MRPDDNEILCHVEGDAPMGKLMRQHWIPACMVEEVSEPDCAPVKVRLLGENIVVWRDTEGRVGALDELCPHRRASLAFGRNEECGLRCLYHGWKMDVNGNIVDMASESDGSKMMKRLKHKAYAVRESGGIVWIWMGDQNNVGAFQIPLWQRSEDSRISIMKMHAACNWAQVLEGAIDSSHSSSLHSSNMPASSEVDGSTATGDAWLRPSSDKSPRIEFQKTSFGFRYAAIRKPNRDAESVDYVRTTLFIAPFTVVIPPNNRYELAQMLVPIDDVNCMFYWIAFHETEGISQDEWRKFLKSEVGADLDKNYRKLRNQENDYLQDRDRMKQGDFTGIEGIPFQDMAMWESMGPIADRSNEKLGSSDLAIVKFRKIMVDAAKAVEAGGNAIYSVEPRIPAVGLRSFEGLVSKSTDWRELNVSQNELSERGN